MRQKTAAHALGSEGVREAHLAGGVGGHWGGLRYNYNKGEKNKGEIGNGILFKRKV